MKKNLLISIFFILGSCTTTKYVYHVNDDLYYSNTNNRSQTYDTITYDYVNDVDNFYYTNNIRRFYQPYFGLNYFSNYYVYRTPFWPTNYYLNYYRYNRGWQYIYNPYSGWDNWCYSGWNNPYWSNWYYTSWNYNWYSTGWNYNWIVPNTTTNTHYGSRGGNSSTNTNNIVNKPFDNRVTSERPIKTKPFQYEQKIYQNNIGTKPTLTNKQFYNRPTQNNFQQNRPATNNSYQNRPINKGQIINSKPNLNPRLN